MKNNRFSFEAAYFAFARKWRVLLMFLLFGLIITANFFLAGAFWQLATLTGPIGCFAVLIFMDYYVFAGFNSRKSDPGMNLLKSSFHGRSLVEAALKQDSFNKSLYMLAGSLAAVISILKFNPDIDKPFMIVYAIGGFSTSLIMMRLSLLITRAKGITLQAHILICYLCYSIGSAILLPLIFLSEKASLPIMAAYAAAAEAGSILTGRWLIVSCLKAYDSGFHDADNNKDREDLQ